MRKCKLGKLLDVTRGVSFLGAYCVSEGERVRLTLANFDYVNNCFQEDHGKDNLFYSKEVPRKFILDAGSIITPLTEQTPGLLGSTARIPESGKYIQSQDVGLIKPFENVLDHDFAYYLVSSKGVKDQLAARSQQTKIRHTSPDKIKDCTVFVPDLSDQRKIGKFLSSIDRLIELSRKRIENLEKLAKEIYDYWFVQFDFPDKRGKPYKTSGGKMVYNAELKREIPAGWKVGRLSSIAPFVDDGVKSDLIDAFHYVTTDSLLQGKAGRRIVDNLPVNTITLTKFKPLDVLVSNIRVYLKKIWFADCSGGCSHDVLVFRAKGVPPEYLYSFLRTDLFFDYVSSAAKGSKMPRGDKSTINFEFPLRVSAGRR